MLPIMKVYELSKPTNDNLPKVRMLYKDAESKYSHQRGRSQMGSSGEYREATHNGIRSAKFEKFVSDGLIWHDRSMLEAGEKFI